MKKILKVSFTLAALFCLAACKQEPPKTEVTAPEVLPTRIGNEPTGQSQRSDYDHYNTGGLEWITLEEALKTENAGNKKYLIDIYTEWCSWCKIMDKKTFSDPAVHAALMDKFNLVKFDAESKEALTFNGETYTFKDAGRKGVHKLAAVLMEGQMSYPSLVFLDPEMKKIKVIRGYKNPTQLLQEIDIITRS